MRRLAVSRASPGMVLGRPLMDPMGRVICEEGEKLQKSVLAKIAIYGIDEIFIDDPQTSDVLVEPLISPELEAQAVQALRQIAVEGDPSAPVDDALMSGAVKSVTDIVKRLYPTALGEPNSAPCREDGQQRFRTSARAAGLAVFLAAKSGLTEETAQAAGMAALLMDLGMARINGTPAGHSQEASKHPVHSYIMVKDSQLVTAGSKAAVLEHHERLDGSGYPRGLKSTQIGQLTRIVGIVETYFAMVSPVPGPKPATRHEAIEYIMAFAGELFDPVFAATFGRSVPAYPGGVMVTISTGERGVVTDPRVGHIGRPAIRLLYDGNGYELKTPLDIDLSADDNRDRFVIDTPEY